MANFVISGWRIANPANLAKLRTSIGFEDVQVDATFANLCALISSSTDSASGIDQRTNVFDTPDRGLGAELDALGEFAIPHASPPSRATDGNDREDLRKPNEACFGQSWANVFHIEHPWLFGDARY